MINRRDVFRGLMATSATGLSGCGLSKSQTDRFLSNCSTDDFDDGRLRIDMHCHLMNARDSSEGAFVNRRLLNPNKNYILQPQSITRLVQGVRRALDSDYQSIRSEANSLQRRIRGRGGRFNLVDFCRLGVPKKNELFASNDGTSSPSNKTIGNGRLTGFFSSRTRNAALLLAQFPKIDIFMPSIVDFYEGGAESYSDPARQMQFYTALAMATKGRFLPMVSFHPQRYFYEVVDRHALTNLDLVEWSIKRAGAIAVKVHPSSGFDPLSNLKYGFEYSDKDCTDRSKNGSWWRHRMEIEDQGMEALYALCHKLDVPILSHSGTSIATNPKCMQQGKDADTWTNSSAHWIQAMKDTRGKGNHRARVALAHFAGGFSELRPGTTDAGSPFPGKDGRIKPSQWLKSAMDHMLATKRHDVYLDLSIMNEIAVSQAVLENQVTGSKPWNFASSANPFAKSVIEAAQIDKGNLAKQFRDFVRGNHVLHDRLMYGSDWHMPNASAVSGQDAFMRLIESALPDTSGIRSKVMGRNAARFFGLEKGGENRRRTEKFLSGAGIDLGEVRWMEKADRRPS